MKKLQELANSRWALTALDVLFICFLFTEAALKHTGIAQAALLLFAGASLLAALLRRRVCVSRWFFFYVLFLLWGAICLRWAISFSTAFSMLRTVAINLIFLVALLQYLVLRPFRTVANSYLLAAFAFIIFVFLRSDPISAMSRFGLDVGINPNAAGMVTTFACGFALYLATEAAGAKYRAWYILPLLLFAFVTLLTGSLKAMLIMMGILALILMLRYPKCRWALPVAGLALLAVLYGMTKSRLMYEVPFFYRGYFHDIVWVRLEGLFLFLESGSTGIFQTAEERGALLDVGLAAIKARPFTGYGLDCFQHLTDAAGAVTGTYSHNNYVELLCSGGVPLLLAYYVPLIWLFILGVHRAKGVPAAKLALVLLLAVFIADFAVVSYYDRSLLLFPALLAAVVWKGKKASGNGPLALIELD